MKIKEMIERECCQQQDLKPYKGEKNSIGRHPEYSFCDKCGQIWLHTKEEDIPCLEKVSI